MRDVNWQTWLSRGLPPVAAMLIFGLCLAACGKKNLAAPGHPVPELTLVSPDSFGVGASGLQLAVTGHNFVTESVVRWTGSPRPTTYVSESRLLAEITATDLAGAGSYPVTVFTPAPGGGSSAGRAVVVTAPPAAPLRVLFLGNSLTYVNQLPVMVDSLAAAAGLRLTITSITAGGYSLGDHYAREESRMQVAAGPFDIVIMQQGPSSLAESRQLLLQYMSWWDPLIRAGGARPALYAVWPEKARMEVFPDVSESYRQAAEAVNGLFFPVGDTWLETWARRPDAQLYGPDDFHPTVLGTYVAAVVIVSILADRDPESLPAHFHLLPEIGVEPDSALAATVRAAAGAVIARQAAPR